jgi:hypothetical protein
MSASPPRFLFSVDRQVQACRTFATLLQSAMAMARLISFFRFSDDQPQRAGRGRPP